MIRSVSRLLSVALLLCLVVPALAQVQPGQSPLSGSKGGTGNAFMQFTGPATSIKTYTLPNASGTIDLLNAIQTITAAKTFNSGTLLLAGSSSGTTTVNASAAASGTLTLPAATDTLVGKATTDTLTNKTFDTAGAGNSFSINGLAVTANTGTGAVARATSPSLTTPTLGVASATSINKVAITAPATSATLTIPDGVTLTGPAASGTAMTLGNAETVTGAKSFNSGTLIQKGSSSGSTTVQASAAASGTLTLPAATDTLVGKATTDTLSNKTIDTASSNTLKVNGNTLSASAGTATLTLPNATDTIVGRATTDTLTNKTLTSPVIGAIVNTGTLTLPTSTDTLVGRATTDTLTNKTIDTASNTFKLNGVAFGTAAQGTAALNAMVGDSGSGGTKGLVPAPGAGDAAAGKFLKADGTFAVPAGGGGGGMTDTERQNAALSLIYQSKLYGGYRRAINQFADGFKASDGINSISGGNCAGSSSNCTIDTTNGRIYPTTTGLTRITGGTPTVQGGGTAANVNDNNPATTVSWTPGDLSAAGINSRFLAKIDYGSNKLITKIEARSWSQTGGSGAARGFYYSTDGTNWTQLGSAPTVTSTPADYSVTGSVTARYVAIMLDALDWTGFVQTLGDLNAYIATPDNMTVVTTAQTASATVSNGRVVVEYDDACGGCTSVTLNTDITVEVTLNGGTNWASATLSSAGLGQSGRKVAETADTAGTSGTSFAARFKTLNNKFIYLHGLSLTVH